MAAIIVNEGSGAQRIELTGLVTLGSNPSCDVVLEHPSALGMRVELKPLKWCYRVKLVKGELAVNEQACDMADLEHNDTLRVGEVLVLYKQPESAEEFAAGAAELEELDLEELEPVEELEELELEEVASGDGGERARGPVEEIDLAAAARGGGDAAEVPAELDDAYQRARLKRLEALRRLVQARQGEPVDDRPLSDPAALETVRLLDADNATDGLLQVELEEGLEDKTVPELLALVEAAVAPEAAEALQEFEALEATGAETETETETTDEPAADVILGAVGSASEPLPFEEEVEAPEETGGAQAEGWRDPIEISPPEEPEPKPAVEELPFDGPDEVDEVEAEAEAEVDVETEIVVEPVTKSETEAELDLEPETEPEPETETEPETEPVAEVVTETETETETDLGPEIEPAVEPELEPVAAATSDVPSGVRPLPPGGIRFARPLPAGLPEPTFLPPVDPGPPPSAPGRVVS